MLSQSTQPTCRSLFTQSLSTPRPSTDQPTWKKVALFIAKILFHIITLGVFLIIDYCCTKKTMATVDTKVAHTPEITEIVSRHIPKPHLPKKKFTTLETVSTSDTSHSLATIKPSKWKLFDSLEQLYKRQQCGETPRAARTFLRTEFGPIENHHFMNSYPCKLMPYFHEVGLLNPFLREPTNPGEAWLFPRIVEQVHYLNEKYYIINVPGDGNCFYRSFAIGWLTSLLSNPENPRALREEIHKLESSSFAKASEKNAALTQRVIAILKLCLKKRTLHFLFNHIFLSFPMTNILAYLQELAHFSASRERFLTMNDNDAKRLLVMQLNDDPSYLQQALTALSEFSPLKNKIISIFYSPESLLNSSQESPLENPIEKLLLLCKYCKLLLPSQQESVHKLVRALGEHLNKIFSPSTERKMLAHWSGLFAKISTHTDYQTFKQRAPHLSALSSLYLYLESLPSSVLDPRIELFLEKIRSKIKKYNQSKETLEDILPILNDSCILEIKETLFNVCFRNEFFIKSIHALLSTISTSLSHSKASFKAIREFIYQFNANFLSLNEANIAPIIWQQQELLTDDYLLNPEIVKTEEEPKTTFLEFLHSLQIENLHPTVKDFLFLINSPKKSEKILKSLRYSALLNALSHLYNSTIFQLIENEPFCDTLSQACMQLCLTHKYSSSLEVLGTHLRDRSDRRCIIKTAFSHPELSFSLKFLELLESCSAVLAPANDMALQVMYSMSEEHIQKLNTYKHTLIVISRKDTDPWDTDHVLNHINESAMFYAFLLNHPDIVETNSDALTFMQYCVTLCNETYSQLEASLPSDKELNQLAQKRLSEAIFFQRMFIQNPINKQLLESLLTSLPLEALDLAFRYSVRQAETEHVAALSREISPFSICQFLGTDETINPYNFSLDLVNHVNVLSRTQGFISLYEPEDQSSIHLLRLSNHYCCLLPIEREDHHDSSI